MRFILVWIVAILSGCASAQLSLRTKDAKELTRLRSGIGGVQPEGLRKSFQIEHFASRTVRTSGDQRLCIILEIIPGRVRLRIGGVKPCDGPT